MDENAPSKRPLTECEKDLVNLCLMQNALVREVFNIAAISDSVRSVLDARANLADLALKRILELDEGY